MAQIRLNENQRKAVEFNDGDLLIIAGAGTGKTAVITQRILHIIKQGWAKPSEILALTFTEKAAQEMQTRIDEQMEYGYEEPDISTFHSFCDHILREDGYHIGIDGNYSLLSTAQAYIFLRKHLYDMSFKTLLPKGNPTKFLNDFIKHISRLQDEDVSPEEYVDYAEKLPKKTEAEREKYIVTNELAQAYKKYSELKIEESKMDFGDLIILTIKLFRERGSVLEKYRKKYKYILVDEFQDTNYTQNVLVDTLKKGEEKPYLTVVGDDDQAIYKFRGAAISNILQFKQRYPKAKEIVLTENYRSRQEILDSAYTLIKHNNPNRLEITENIDKKLVAKGAFDPNSEPVKLIVSKNEIGEAERVAEEIKKLTGYAELTEQLEDKDSQTFDERGQSTFLDSQRPSKDAKFKFSDFAILVRANANVEPFVQAFRSEGIRYKLGGARGLYFREEIKNIIAFLRVLVDYTDEVSMYKLLTMPVWKLSSREYIDLAQLAREEKVTLLEFLENEWKVKIGSGENVKDNFKNIDSKIIDKLLSPQAIAGISSLLLLLDAGMSKIKEGRQITEIIYDFVMQSLYIGTFLEDGDAESLFAVGNIEKYFQLVKKYEKDNPDGNIYEYVDYLNYSIQIGESPLIDEMDIEDLNAVNILTVHSAKGLEFPVVFLVNLVVDRFPARGRSDAIPIPEDLVKETGISDLSAKESNLQEERRLFYVGATRAKDLLYLTAANFYGDAKRRKKPSVFLHELLDRDVEEDFSERLEVETFTDNVIHLTSSGNLDKLMIPPKELTKIVKRFSYSQLNVYKQCPRKYEYAYILRIPTKGNAATAFGTTIHNTLRDFYTLLRRSREGLSGIVQPPTKKDLLDLYDKNWVKSGYENRKQESIRKAEGEIIIKNYYDKVFLEDDNPLRLEESFGVHFGDIVFSGKIDRIDLVKDAERPEVSIVDYKTGSEKDKNEIKKDLQLPLYALVAEQKLGFKVVGAKYIFVETGKVVDVDVSESRKEMAKEKLLETLGCIKNGNFTPTPGFICRFCDFNSICEYAE